ncbi:PREDICTED: FYVE, RhoGEF and PH domain-containing protein 4-like [Priapulus caudatus]|uniref:FYVE, RhoGEF and PH domain-containing protein 4-like n=1 Tax=Priapulus caudatus TaxID=37621 RepID=A0ABM1DWP1_PRICU|nr:PREDICTED: FYVE, RhoGEF and PH domain-containing protein 4-like [Priapulus caudatus]
MDALGTNDRSAGLAMFPLPKQTKGRLAVHADGHSGALGEGRSATTQLFILDLQQFLANAHRVAFRFVVLNDLEEGFHPLHLLKWRACVKLYRSNMCLYVESVLNLQVVSLQALQLIYLQASSHLVLGSTPRHGQFAAEQRMQEWEKVKRIGDIMLRFAPFLKMYTEYVNNYEMAQKLINIWLVKSNRFRAIVDELSKLPECDNMLILNHMLVPVQRVPRYELLLKEYLKRLPGDSADRADAEKALSCVSAAAHHINNAMRKIHKFKKLLEIRDLLGGAVDLVSPSREFIKEGRLVKISARSGDHQERYLFLFSDMALLCSELSVSRRGAKYKVRARLQVDQLQCLEGDNLEIENTLYIKTHVRAIELYTRTPFEKMQWMESLLKVIQDYEAKCNSVRISEELLKIEDKELGRCAPTFAKGAAVPVCMNCKAAFGLLRKRKHCKACGAVVCAKCIHGKMALPYDQHKLNKVCRKCYQTMQRITQEKERKMKGDAPIARPERLNVPKVRQPDSEPRA